MAHKNQEENIVIAPSVPGLVSPVSMEVLAVDAQSLALDDEITKMVNGTEPSKSDENATQEPPTLSNLPTEVVHLIMDQSKKGGAVCLGLTSRRNYQILKTRFPEKINIQCSVTCGGDSHSDCWRYMGGVYFGARRKERRNGMLVAELLVNWFGPKYIRSYKFHEEDSLPPFLSREVYAPEAIRRPQITGMNDIGMTRWTQFGPLNRLKMRYNDYNHYQENGSARGGNWKLDSPFNKGLDWYDDSLAKIKATLYECQDVFTWRGYWRRCHLFHEYATILEEIVDEYKLGLYLEGFLMLGL